MKRRRRSVNDIPRARAALARKKFTFCCSSGSCTRRIEFYFHSVKVVAPPVLHWPPPPPRAYQTYTVFLILILSPLQSAQTSFPRGISFCWNLLPRDSSALLFSSSPYWSTDQAVGTAIPFPSPSPLIVYFLFFLFFFSPPPSHRTFPFLLFSFTQLVHRVHRMRL